MGNCFSAKGKMEKITFGDNLPGYVAGAAGAPGVVCVQEWWGITDEIKEQALKIASKGFRVLVPDLYKGKIGVDKEEAHHLMSNLDFPGAVKEITQAVEFLRSSGSSKVGVVGFCMGGALSLAAAQHAGVDCAAPFYGIPAEAICQPEKIAVPVEGHFGEADAMKGFSDKDSALKLEAKLKKSPAGAQSQVFIYPGEAHAFLNSTSEASAKHREQIGAHPPKPENQQLAWERLFAFFDKHLKQ